MNETLELSTVMPETGLTALDSVTTSIYNTANAMAKTIDKGLASISLDMDNAKRIIDAQNTKELTFSAYYNALGIPKSKATRLQYAGAFYHEYNYATGMDIAEIVNNFGYTAASYLYQVAKQEHGLEVIERDFSELAQLPQKAIQEYVKQFSTAIKQYTDIDHFPDLIMGVVSSEEYAALAARKTAKQLELSSIDSSNSVQVETAPDNVPETAPDRVPETAPDRVPETAPDRVPETAPDTVLETAPDNVLDSSSINETPTPVDNVPETPIKADIVEGPVYIEPDYTPIHEEVSTDENVAMVCSITETPEKVVMSNCYCDINVMQSEDFAYNFASQYAGTVNSRTVFLNTLPDCKLSKTASKKCIHLTWYNPTEASYFVDYTWEGNGLTIGEMDRIGTLNRDILFTTLQGCMTSIPVKAAIPGYPMAYTVQRYETQAQKVDEFYHIFTPDFQHSTIIGITYYTPEKSRKIRAKKAESKTTPAVDADTMTRLLADLQAGNITMAEFLAATTN